MLKKEHTVDFDLRYGGVVHIPNVLADKLIL